MFCKWSNAVRDHYAMACFFSKVYIWNVNWSMPNNITNWAIRPKHLLSHDLNTGSGGIDIFEIKLAFEMLTMHRQQHSFSTHVLATVSTFLRQKLSRPEGGLEPPIFGFMPNALTIWAIRARRLLSRDFEHGLWWCRYFCSKVDIWNVNCARATAFIFDTRTDVLAKVSKFLRQKISRPEGDSNPQSSDSFRML